MERKVQTMINKVYFLTLGCSKNDIDTECMISLLDKNKYEHTENFDEANIVIINTCSFILDAKEQSINSIIELGELKNQTFKYLLVAGCLGQRYPEQLLDEMEEIDGIIGTGQISNINEILDSTVNGERKAYVGSINAPYTENASRNDFKVTQYIKISEGCNNHCAYCVIPSLRGRMRSRPIENILNEAIFLAQNGVKELILIAQNTSEYGTDIYGKPMLHELLHELNQIEDLHWIRILYMYSEGFYDELIDAIATCAKVVKYVDMPLQHISDDVLKAMNRHTDKKSICDLIIKLRKRIPNIVIRSTFIVCFYNETREDFEELKKFIEEYKLDRIGAFCYSLEEGTRAYKYGDQVSEDEKLLRQKELMLLQAEISERKLCKKVGLSMECLIEDETDDAYIGRTYMDAPGIDGLIYINKDKALNIGEFYDIIITGNDSYDLYGKLVLEK
ncbi:30S ribosomal protein S12 methylthiotransferase RimO [Ezakiella peruensis]|uniref:30S ribosomal protein S12 methylthiotransferase RimO n=1 Tax=Ezakiella peruensis TaxID=1464038 RepID=UPI001FEB75BB|nr:30S ribosomal protein S12 methylthiotransferase RimO [Ezakiella peruensis]